MIKLTPFLSVVFILTACTNNQQKVANAHQTDSVPVKEVIAQKPNSSPDTTFKLDYFPAIPDTLSGCSDSYTYDTTTIALDKYIFLSNLTEFAIIRVKGATIYLIRDSLESKETSEGNFISVFKGNGYKATLKAHKVKSYDEGGLFKGTLEITGDKIKTTFKIQGESGC